MYSLVLVGCVFGTLVAENKKSQWVQLGEVIVGDTNLFSTEVEIEDASYGYQMSVLDSWPPLSLLWPEKPERISSQNGVVTYSAGKPVGAGQAYTLFIFYNPELQGLKYPKKLKDLKDRLNDLSRKKQEMNAKEREQINQAWRGVASQVITKLKNEWGINLLQKAPDQEYFLEQRYSEFTYRGTVQSGTKPNRTVPIVFRIYVAVETIYVAILQGEETSTFLDGIQVMEDTD